MKTSAFIIISLFSSGVCLAAKVSGYVFVDTNGNGAKDQAETGIVGVAVSDQVGVVLTDASGYYELPENKGFGQVFASVPSGFRATRSYYQPADPATDVRIDFGMSKLAAATSFTFVHASDTHISDKSLDRMKKFKAVVDSLKPDFVIVTGDLIRDALRVPEKEATSLYELYKAETAKFPVAFWNAPGNHEIFGIERHLSLVSPQHPLYGRKMFRHFLGPDYYSFNYGGVHFIALNSLEYDDLWYYGSIDSVQQEWLKKDLAAVAPNVPVVTFQHVPFFSAQPSYSGYVDAGPARTLEDVKGKKVMRHVVSNAPEVIRILRSRNYPLALGGHHHARQKLFLETEGQQTRFEQAAAVIGTTDEALLKLPSGVTFYKVTKGVFDPGTFIPLR